MDFLKDFDFDKKEPENKERTGGQKDIPKNQLGVKKDTDQLEDSGFDSKGGIKRNTTPEFDLPNPTKQINKVDLNPKNNRNPFGDELEKGFNPGKESKKDLEDPFGDFDFGQVEKGKQANNTKVAESQRSKKRDDDPFGDEESGKIAKNKPETNTTHKEKDKTLHKDESAKNNTINESKGEKKELKQKNPDPFPLDMTEGRKPQPVAIQTHGTKQDGGQRTKNENAMKVQKKTDDDEFFDDLLSDAKKNQDSQRKKEPEKKDEPFKESNPKKKETTKDLDFEDIFGKPQAEKIEKEGKSKS